MANIYVLDRYLNYIVVAQRLASSLRQRKVSGSNSPVVKFFFHFIILGSRSLHVGLAHWRWHNPNQYPVLDKDSLEKKYGCGSQWYFTVHVTFKDIVYNIMSLITELCCC